MGVEREVTRRGFLRTTGLAVVGGGVVSGVGHEEGAGEENRQEPRVRAHRILGRTGFQVSDIGYGTGFLTNSNVLAVGLDMGINYIDTAEHYMNGQSERAVGEVLKGRDRSSLFITTKLNLSMGGDSKEELKQRFQACLERMQTDYADCLMIHMTPRAEQVTHQGFHDAAEELKAEGRVRFLGLSNHGTEHSAYGRTESSMEDVLGAAAEDGRFDMALFVYNFLQKEQGERIIDVCMAREMGVTLMKTNPVGVVARYGETAAEARARGRISEARERTLREYEAWAGAAEDFKQLHGVSSATEVRDAAIKFCLDNPGVHTVCPSINTFDDLQGFLALSGQTLSARESPMLASYEALLGQYYCRHACGICEPSCPYQVPINTIARYGHYFDVQSREKRAIQKYAALRGPKADVCMECEGHCENACPHQVPVRTLLTRAHENLSFAE